MKELILIIDEIIKFGMNPSLEIEDKEENLEKYIIQLYACSFKINYTFDEETEYEDFDKSIYSKIRENVCENFPDFGFYHLILNTSEVTEKPQIVIGDAIDDLTDIIFDLLEIRWRNENNSKNDALQFFELIFKSHTQKHVIDLLNFMKCKC